MRAADDDVRLFPGDHREDLVHVKIVAGQKRETDAFHFDGRDRRILVTVTDVKSARQCPRGLFLARRGMRLEEAPDRVSVPVKCVRRVPPSVFCFVSGIDEDHRMAAFRGFFRFPEDQRIVLFYGSKELLRPSDRHRDVRILRQYDQVVAFIQGIDPPEQAFKTAVCIRFLKRIFRLNQRNFHLLLRDRMDCMRKIIR